MARRPATLQAEERSTYIERAIADWRRLVAQDAVPIPWNGGAVLWNEALGYWSFFGKARSRTELGWRWWNAFGQAPQSFRQNMLVEINPPQRGPAKGTQGLVARDDEGRRWLLHGGRVHPSDERVSHEQFKAMSGLGGTPVVFSDGRIRPYFKVAPLDAGAEALNRGVAAFVETCGDVRTQVLYGRREAELDRRVREQEGGTTPEKRGDYVLPPRDAAVAKRVHAEVFAALKAVLDRRKIQHSNRRVGRYGPDLRTRDAPLVLFEIKTDTTARSLYEALGQLLMYERLLGKAYLKVVVLPRAPAPDLNGVLEKMNIRVLVYGQSGRSFAFDPRTFGGLFGES